MSDAVADRSNEPGFRAARTDKAWRSPVYFRRETEPYISTAVASDQPDAGVMFAEVNLKFVRDVVSAIKSGEHGHAYVVDARGRLISHPDLSLVLKMTDLSAMPQVRAALSADGARAAPEQTVIAEDERGLLSLTAYAPIGSLGWSVLVEQPLADAEKVLEVLRERGIIGKGEA